MTGKKARIIRRFEKEAKKKNNALREVGLRCICGDCNLASFNIQEIKDIINLEDKTLPTKERKR